MKHYVVGIDFGTDSCRAVIVDVNTGSELATQVAFYPRWAKGMYCDSGINQYRQHPQDYIDTLVESVQGAIAQLPAGESSYIVAIGIDTTGSTPVLVDRSGTPLALLPQHADKPDAMFILWKDHTAIREADEINKLAHSLPTDYTSLSGGIYSSEWFWAKALRALRNDESLREDAWSIIEHCDWMPAVLTGNLKPEITRRSRCAAGHKGMWAQEWGGYPPEEFLSQLDPLLKGFRARLPEETYTSDTSAGKLSNEWAEQLGLLPGIEICTGILDAHAGAVGAGIAPKTMVKIVGTSTCDILVVPNDELHTKIPGISGQVDGSVLPGMSGLEAGQSAFGDVYAWFKKLLTWTLEGLDEATKKEESDRILARLTEEARHLPVNENSLIAIDWLNGRRTPYADLTKKGIIAGITLGTTAPEIFRSLVEATAFGSKAILEHLKKEGVEITEVIGVGGISKKSDFVMQLLSDILAVPIRIAATEQAGALGAAMFAAVASEIIPDILHAQQLLGKGFEKTFYPRAEESQIYARLYAKYLSLGNIL